MVSRVTAIPVGLAYYRVAMLTAKGGLMSERVRWLVFQLPPPKSAKNYPRILHPAHDYDEIFIAFDILQLKKDQSYQI
jgi:hypothetical protein